MAIAQHSASGNWVRWSTWWKINYWSRLLSAGLLVWTFGVTAASGGDDDSHLTATYALARQIGFTHDEANTIAWANRNVDYEAATTPLPKTADGLRQLPSTLETYHAMVQDRSLDRAQLEAEVRTNLGKLNADVIAATTKDQKLKAVGRYLHALQDSYFHQQDGKPYASRAGHASKFHQPDRVAGHFDSAAKAYAATYDALKQYKATESSQPKLDLPMRQIYREGADVFAPGELREIRERKGVLTLAKAIADSNDAFLQERVKSLSSAPIKGRPRVDHWTTDVQIKRFGPHDAELLRRNVKALAADDPSYKPPVSVDAPKTKPEVASLKIQDVARRNLTQDAFVRSAMSGRGVGGISLGLAAATGMSIGIDIEGMSLKDGHIVLAGRGQRAVAMDAALLMTALRLACAKGDPYFSLDPPDGAAWTAEGNAATQELSKLVSEKLNARRGAFMATDGANTIADGLSIETFSARRDFPKFWSTVQARYPNFKSQLVFSPQWLAETRLGEILYKADVLLKELSGGLPAFDVSRPVRANSINGYLSSDTRSAGMTLLSSFDTNGDHSDRVGWNGHRLWFDMVQDVEPRDGASKSPARPSSSAGRELWNSLNRMGALDAGLTVKRPALASDARTVDLSGLFPTMLVRRHDATNRTDIPGEDFALTALSADVNSRMPQFVETYDELKALTSVFRTYVSALAIIEHDSRFCPWVKEQALFDTERVSEPLPEFHPTELFVTVASFAHSDWRRRSLKSQSVSSNNGGVSLRGKALLTRAISISNTSPLLEKLNNELAGGVNEPAWSRQNLEFAALYYDADIEAAQPWNRKIITADNVFDELRRQDERLAAERNIFDSNVERCQQGSIISCDAALVSGLLQSDVRRRLTEHRTALLKQMDDKRAERERVSLKADISACVKGADVSCNAALISPLLSSDERSSILLALDKRKYPWSYAVSDKLQSWSVLIPARAALYAWVGVVAAGFGMMWFRSRRKSRKNVLGKSDPRPGKGTIVVDSKGTARIES